jgi:3-isopropylmalate dehydrogenase
VNSLRSRFPDTARAATFTDEPITIELAWLPRIARELIAAGGLDEFLRRHETRGDHEDEANRRRHAGDGIGAIVVPEALRVLDAARFDADYVTAEIGWSCWVREGNALPQRTIDLLAAHKTGLLGAITSKPPAYAEAELPSHLEAPRPEYTSPILALRQHFGQDVCLRPCRSFPGNPTNFVRQRADGTIEAPALDIVVFRQNTEGLYAGVEWTDPPVAVRQALALPSQVRPVRRGHGPRSGRDRPARHARGVPEDPRRRVPVRVGPSSRDGHTRRETQRATETSGLFEEVAREVARSWPSIALSVVNIDALFMDLARRPEDHRVIVASNLFGDILSDAVAGLTGGPGFACSANIGGDVAIFEPSHGSSPRHADLAVSIVNPIAAILAGRAARRALR